MTAATKNHGASGGPNSGRGGGSFGDVGPGLTSAASYFAASGRGIACSPARPAPAPLPRHRRGKRKRTRPLRTRCRVVRERRSASLTSRARVPVARNAKWAARRDGSRLGHHGKGGGGVNGLLLRLRDSKAQLVASDPRGTRDPRPEDRRCRQ